MDETKDTGVEYPTLTLGDGNTYTVKFTRGTLYRLSKAGVKFSPVFTKNSSSASLSNVIDTLKVVIDYPGTAEELTEIAFDQKDEILSVLCAAWVKVALPTIQKRIDTLLAPAAASKQLSAA